MADDDASIFIGSVDPQISERMMYELLVQMGPLESLHLAVDEEGVSKEGFAFCLFEHKSSADYAIRVLDTVRLFNRPIRVNRQQSENPSCKVFVGGLSYDCREEELHDLFSVFGSIDQIIMPKECMPLPVELPLSRASASVACRKSVRWRSGLGRTTDRTKLRSQEQTQRGLCCRIARAPIVRVTSRQTSSKGTP
jgi:RNA recognition motif-containing protein